MKRDENNDYTYKWLTDNTKIMTKERRQFSYLTFIHRI